MREYTGYAANIPAAAPAEDQKMLKDLANTFSTTTACYVPETTKQTNTILRTYIRFCIAYGHQPIVKDKGISTEVLIEYAIFLVFLSFRQHAGT